MSTSSNLVRADKPNEASDKSLSGIEATVHLYCDSERQSHDNDTGILQASSIKSKGCVDEFIAFLAHEVRNPLTSINLSTEILNASLDNHELRKYLDVIKRNTARINNLITRMLNYQAADETDEIKSSAVNTVNEVMEMMDDRIRLKNIAVVKSFCSEDFLVVANQSKIKIAITNIVVNAIDAMPAENAVLKISTQMTGDKYLVEIEDNGCGINKKNLPSIFNTGFTNKPGGLGFGLHITRVILESNNVEIKVTSTEGEGTKFTLSFNKN